MCYDINRSIPLSPPIFLETSVNQWFTEVFLFVVTKVGTEFHESPLPKAL